MSPHQKIRAHLAICDIHAQQLAFMLSYLRPMFPMTAEKLRYASPIDIALLDSIGHRFAKLQAIIGEKLFVLISNMPEEEKPYRSYKIF